jgi:hypothetical protein
MSSGSGLEGAMSARSKSISGAPNPVKTDGKTDQITREPEQVKPFRDTWRDGIHNLSFLRDRFTVVLEVEATRLRKSLGYAAHRLSR